MKKSVNTIDIWVLGDFGPFSRTGKSVGYMVSIGETQLLVDCGAPLFDVVGADGLKDIDGLILTHCHDDHKRWFTDLALFHYYASNKDKLFFLSTEEVYSELVRASKAALDRSLSMDSKRIVDISMEDYVNFRPLGPTPRYQITGYTHDGIRGKLHVVDEEGNRLGPDRAKIVLSDKGGRARMLFKEPGTGEWVEPESYYSYGCEEFYKSNARVYEGDGFTLEALNASVWHGIPGIALKFSTQEETVIFSSDTVNDLELWESLAGDKRRQDLGKMSPEEFEAAEVIYGDINDYIERTWSPKRLEEAKAAFKGAAVIHDVSLRDSVVHTDYNRLGHTTLTKEQTILTHSPDQMTSEWLLCYSEKVYRAQGGRFYELKDGKTCSLDADVYHKTDGTFYVGYKNPEGRYAVMEDDGILDVVSAGGSGDELFRVDLYEDIGGEYFPRLDPSEGQYSRRADGKVELMKFADSGSVGKVVKGCRDDVCGK